MVLGRVVDPRWLRGIGSRRDTAGFRVYLFPHAGGSASAYLWDRHFPDDVEVCAVQLPGREGRFLEAPVTAMDAAVDELAPTIVSTVDLPFVFFGHSMGALIAFNVTRRLAAAGAPLPQHLFVSARRAPHLTDHEPIHALPEDELLARLGDSRLARLSGELRETVMPILRADLTLCETYRYTPGRPLPVPITAFGGYEDEMASESGMAAWREHTARAFDLRMFPGGHFYLRGMERELAAHINELAVREQRAA
jgi:medium-chain acyl-[acyl-carrier-protein] hydrolase